MPMEDPSVDRSLNALSRDVIGAAIHVHRDLGPGRLESIYVDCLEETLEEAGFNVGREVVVPVTFEGRELEGHYRLTSSSRRRSSR